MKQIECWCICNYVEPIAPTARYTRNACLRDFEADWNGKKWKNLRRKYQYLSVRKTILTVIEVEE